MFILVKLFLESLVLIILIEMYFLLSLENAFLLPAPHSRLFVKCGERIK